MCQSVSLCAHAVDNPNSEGIKMSRTKGVMLHLQEDSSTEVLHTRAGEVTRACRNPGQISSKTLLHSAHKQEHCGKPEA